MKFTVASPDGQTISIAAMVTEIWRNYVQDNFDVIIVLCDMLCKFMNEQQVFVEFEQHVLQFVHMATHIGVAESKHVAQSKKGGHDYDVQEALERVIYTSCQISIPMAIKMSSMFQSAMEDFQMENPEGEPNPLGNAFLFYRCARICETIESVVLYGTPILRSQEVAQLTVKIGGDAVMKVVDTTAHTRLLQIMASNNNRMLTTTTEANEKVRPRLTEFDEVNADSVGGKRGYLLFKRNHRRGMLYGLTWKKRYFRIEQRVLFCQRKPTDAAPLRSLYLVGCELMSSIGDQSLHHPFTIVIKKASTNECIQVRCSDQTEYDSWHAALQREIEFPALPPYPNNFEEQQERTKIVRMKRWTLFSQQRTFLTEICDICERLRFIERSMRPPFMRRDIKNLVIPPFSFLPLASSVDRYHYILNPVPSKAHAFRTKARCPVLMHFEVEEHPNFVDSATFLATEIQNYSMTELKKNVTELQTTDAEETALGLNDEEDGVSLENIQVATDQIHDGASRIKFCDEPLIGPWRNVGTGFERLMQDEDLKEHELKPSPLAASSATILGVICNSEKVSMRAISSADVINEVAKYSPYSHLPAWEVAGFIAKSNDDLRQEIFVMQLIRFYNTIFTSDTSKNLWLKTYEVVNIGKYCGIIELIKNSASFDEVKKNEAFPGTMYGHFLQKFGIEADKDCKPGDESATMKTAIHNFCDSMAAYSIVCYLLAIKDRHNGNIMLDQEGHVIHIDFGFVFGIAPGKQFSMETCPFKLTKDMLDVMRGKKSPYYQRYFNACVDAMILARKYASQTSQLVQIMAKNSAYPCFKYNPRAYEQFVDRHCFTKKNLPIKGSMKKVVIDDSKERETVEKIISGFVYASYAHYGTGMYDSFQTLTNGIKK